MVAGSLSAAQFECDPRMMRSLTDFRKLFSTLITKPQKVVWKEERRWLSPSVERTVPQKAGVSVPVVSFFFPMLAVLYGRGKQELELVAKVRTESLWGGDKQYGWYQTFSLLSHLLGYLFI